MIDDEIARCRREQEMAAAALQTCADERERRGLEIWFADWCCEEAILRRLLRGTED